MATRSRARPPREAREVTARQREVLALIALGLTNKEMAHSLGISERGAAAHVSRLLATFRAPNRAGLIARTLTDAVEGKARGAVAASSRVLSAMIERELEAYRTSAFMIGLTLGPENVLVYVNEAGTRICGISPESPTSARFLTRRASPGTKSFRGGSERAFRTGQPTTVETEQARWLRDDGTWSNGRFSCVLQPVRDVEASVFGILWICMPTPENG
jgi:DNA-binding CsgD family transcriptional regulator